MNKSSTTQPTTVKVPDHSASNNAADSTKDAVFSNFATGLEHGPGATTSSIPKEQSIFKCSEGTFSDGREPLKKRQVLSSGIPANPSSDKWTSSKPSSMQHSIDRVTKASKSKAGSGATLGAAALPYSDHTAAEVPIPTATSVASGASDWRNFSGAQSLDSTIPLHAASASSSSSSKKAELSNPPPVAARTQPKKAVKPAKRRSWTKPKDKPKRPLSAYNLFFKHERERILNTSSLDQPEVSADSAQSNNDHPEGSSTAASKKRRHRKSHGKIGFAQLARHISERWNNLDAAARSVFEAEAEIEKKRYKKEIEVWKEAQKAKRIQEDAHEAAAIALSNLKSNTSSLSGTVGFRSSSKEHLPRKTWYGR